MEASETKISAMGLDPELVALCRFVYSCAQNQRENRISVNIMHIFMMRFCSTEPLALHPHSLKQKVKKSQMLKKKGRNELLTFKNNLEFWTLADVMRGDRRL